ncbi:DUF2269 family protein [Ideonella sp.]|uniref:DUF2269 family protein n=1 Tax=Ideonella sp. TaxID=1929293 RepID=UPI0035AF754B
MSTYLVLKWLHVLSSVLLVGTGFGTAFFGFFAHRSGNLQAQAVVGRLVVRADSWFTTPAAIFQPLSGIALAHLAGWPLGTPWLATSIGLFALTGACWLPVLWLQWRMAQMAGAAVARSEPLPPAYARYARCWQALGYPAFIAMLGVYYLMVNKPALWR